MDEAQAQEYIDTFFETYKRILPYFEEEYEKLIGPGCLRASTQESGDGSHPQIPQKKERQADAGDEGDAATAGRVPSSQGLSGQAQRAKSAEEAWTPG